MRFKVSEGQASILDLVKQQKIAAASTLQVALSHHDQVRAELFTMEDDTWSEIIGEHNLDIVNHSWEVVYDEDDVPYVTVLAQDANNSQEG